MARMFDTEWANTELIPLLIRGYGSREGIGEDFDWWRALDEAEVLEPWHMVRKFLQSYNHFSEMETVKMMSCLPTLIARLPCRRRNF
jgi:hypothetical protein